jgi:hypothetical protein
MFSIYKKVSQIAPKVGDVIQYGRGKVIIIEILSKGYFIVDEEECYELRVKK